MRKQVHVLFLFIILIVINHSAFGVIAYPYPVQIIQPDGTKITIILKGDEHVKWAETVDGYSIMRNSKGIYEYAILDSNSEMVPSGIPVRNLSDRRASDNQFLGRTRKGLTYSKSQVGMMKSISKMYQKSREKVFPTTGSRKLVCILIGFHDKAFTKTQEEFNSLFNQVGYTTGGATGSVKDFYAENSYNQFDLTVTVAGPFTAANNLSYYGANDTGGNDIRPRELVTEAVNLADPTVDFTEFDNDGDGTVDGVYVIYAGYGEEASGGADCIWAHAGSITPVTKDGKTVSRYSCSPELRGNSGTTITAIGVICHEFGHVLGAADFYDTNYGTNGQYDGTGYWDLMASGSWNNNGVTPAQHNPYTKITYYAWATATTLTSGTSINITLSNAEENNNSFYRVSTVTTNEYFLIENRQQYKFDTNIPGHGMIIYHVDGNYISTAGNGINAGSHQGMYPVCASATGNPPTTYGTINSGGLPFPGTGNKTSFTDATTPNSLCWAGANTNKPITNITENISAKTVSFSFVVNTTAPTAITLPASGILATAATLNAQVSANSASTTVSFEYGTTTSYGFTVNGTPNTVTGETLTNIAADLTGLTSNTTYNYRVKAVNSVGTTYGSNMTTSVFLMNNDPVTTCFGTFYDSGGDLGSYTNNEDYTKVFTPGTSGNKMSFNFTSFVLEANYDYLFIYDGPNTSSPAFPGSPFTGSLSPGIITATSSNTTGSITFRFTSDISITPAGWAADVLCITPCVQPTTQASAFTYSAITNNSMTAGWTRGNGNAVLVVARAGSAVNASPVSGTTYTANAAFGSGTQIGTGNYVVYMGTGTSVNLSALTTATTYYYAIYEYNSAGYCYKTPALTGNATTTCTPPTSQATAFTSSAITSTTLTAGWTRGNGTSVMVVARAGSAVNSDPVSGTTYTANAAFGSGTQIGTGNYVVYKGTGTSVNLSALTTATTYYYAIYEYNSAGYCYQTPALTGNATTTCTPPATPTVGTITQPTCTVSTGSVVLSNLPATGTWTVTITPGGTTTTGTETSTTISALAAGTYTFTVTNESGCTSPASANVVINAQPTVPPAPTANPATNPPTQTSFTANWSSTATATGYRLDVSTNSAFTTFVTGYNDKDVGNVISYSVTGLTAITTYYYCVRANNSCGAGPNSGTITITTLPDPPSAPAANAATSITQTSFTANWSSSATATGYLLDVATDNGFNSFVPGFNNKDIGNLTNTSVTGLTAFTTYYYRVRAYNTGGTSPTNSSTITAKTLPYAPAAPGIRPPTIAGQTTFTANWDSSATATGYRLDVSTNIAFSTTVTGYNDKDVGNVTKYNVTGLTVKTLYYYQVRANNTGGTSGNSIAATVTTLTNPPAAPTGLTAASCNNLVTLKWAKNNDPYFSRYRIYAGTTNNPTTKIDSTTNTISDTLKVISGLTNGQTYYFRITAVNYDGPESSFSTQTTDKVKTGVIPKIKAKWSDVLICYNLGDSIKSYQWYIGGAAISKATSQYYVTGKKAGAYNIETIDKNGCVNKSSTISISGTKSLSVYPNPASVSFALKLNDESDARATVSILNSTGVKVMEFQVENVNDEILKEIPVKQLDEGIYIVKVLLDNKELYFTKIVVIN